MAKVQREQFIESIRNRPAMYVGDTSTHGLHHMAFDVLEGCIAERLNGFGTQIAVCLHDDWSLEIADDGRSVPLAPIPEFDGQSMLQIAFTRIEVGANYRGPTIWHVGHGGLHGMGITVANALSEWLTAETSDGETSSLQRFERGVPVGEMVQSSAAWHGLRVRFKPDPTIFELPCFLQKDIVSRVVELTALNPDIKVEVSDERTSESGVIAFPDGAAGLVRLMNRGLTPAYDDILAVSHRSDSFRLDVALQHVEEPGLRARPYVNAIHTIEGGTHWTGFQTGLTKSVQQALKIAGRECIVTGESLLRGLTVVVSVWVDDPQFEGPTRTKFAYAAIRGTVESIVYRGLKDALTQHSKVLDAIVARSRQGTAADADWVHVGHDPWGLADLSSSLAR